MRQSSIHWPVLFLLACINIPIVSNFASNSLLHAQAEITPDQWREDLRFLQKTVHDDYPFLFKKITAEEFDASVEELNDQIPKLQQHEIVAGLARIVSQFGYGHTRLGVERSPVKFHQIPVHFYQFQDGIYLQGVHQDYADILGAKVVAVEGKPVDEVVEAIREVVPVENEQFLKAYGLRYLGIPEVLHAQKVSAQLKETVLLTLEINGKTFEKSIKGLNGLRIPTRYGFVRQSGTWLSIRKQAEPPHYLRNLDKRYAFEYLPREKAVYVRQSQVLDDPQEPIPDFYQRVFDFVEKNDVEKFILDVRLNGGGNNYKNKPVVTGIVRSTKINQVGKLFVITGRRTFSACQNLVNELDNYTNAIFVGEPTAENINFYGDTREVVLPNSKIPAFLSFAWWQDKPQWENGPWLAPQIAVDLSIEEFQNNQDPALETILQFADSEFIVDPMEYMKQLFMEGKLERLESEALRLVNDSRYRYYDFEAKINQAGYELVGINQADQARAVFQLNAKLFPNSANVWDSLAESFLNEGQKDKAVQLYQKASKLDPNGEIGDNARSMLKRIQSD